MQLLQAPLATGYPITNEILHTQQCLLSNILETAVSYDHAKQLLQSSLLAGTGWQIENWQPHMLETAIAIAQKWKNGQDGS